MQNYLGKIEFSDINVHFVGIGGIGMCGIAEVFHNRGYNVSGSDQSESKNTKRLRNIGIKLFKDHDPRNVHGAQVVVKSTAVPNDNPEIVEARRLKIPVIRRAEMLGELMRKKIGIAVAGTHGKTTTTTLMSSILIEANLDPTVVIGGIVDSFESTAKQGEGDFVLAEADESDGSFLHLPATFCIITNIDADHLDHFESIENVDAAFLDFVSSLPFYGKAVVCGDDPGVERCLSRFSKPFLTYGFSDENDYVAKNIVLSPEGATFDVLKNVGLEMDARCLGEIKIGFLGRHNVKNALATVALSESLGLDFETIARGLLNCRGVARRFEIHFRDEKSKTFLVEDYAHHPTEIVATLAAAKQFHEGRILVIFQPHRYSRTLHNFDAFLTAFSNSDIVFVTNIYPAGEAPIEGVTAANLVNGISRSLPEGKRVFGKGDLNATCKAVEREIKYGDLVLVMGAGSISLMCDELKKWMEKNI